MPVKLDPDWGSRKMAVLDGRQCRCLTYDEGSEWIHGIDELPPRVRQRLANSQFNICPACVDCEARNNANGPPTIGLYLLVITAIERTLDRAERSFNNDTPGCLR